MLVGAGRLAGANSMTTAANFIARLAGPAAGGALVAAAGLRGTAVFDAATFGAAAAACALIRGSHPAVRLARADRRPTGLPNRARRVARDLSDGITALAGSRTARAVAVFLAVISVGEGMMSALFAVWITTAVHAGGRQMGWMLSAQAIGGILGSLVIFNLPRWHCGLWILITLFFCIGVPAGAGYPPLMTLFSALHRTACAAACSRSPGQRKPPRASLARPSPER
jgi:MFS family permease